MTLDDFLRAFATLVDERDASEDDDPGQGNYGCEDCRACNNCRFCIGCDSCEDCTYCEECLECTSCTQSKRCVDCKKVSYCEDSRDCKDSRYLTLCVDCRDCVHCLACVGLEGGEFFVLNKKRSRKEYFALLRQLQELMQSRMDGGWRPPNIGLASDIFDPALAEHDGELSAAPWLEELLAGAGMGSPPDPEFDGHRPQAARRGHRDAPEFDPRLDPEFDPRRDDFREPQLEPPRHPRESARQDPPAGRPPPGRQSYAREGSYEREEGSYEREEGSYGREGSHERDEGSHERARAPQSTTLAPERDERGSGRLPPRSPGRSRRPEYDTSGSRRRPGTDTQPPPRRRAADDDLDWVSEPPAYGSSYDDRADERTIRRPHRQRPDYGDDLGRALDPEDEWASEPSDDPDDDPDYRVPRYHPAEDSQALTNVPAQRKPEPPTQPFYRADRGGDDAPAPRANEPSSPWLDEKPQGRRKAKHGTLRRAGRPKRPGSEGTGNGTGSENLRGEGTHTGLRTGRKPKKRRR